MKDIPTTGWYRICYETPENCPECYSWWATVRPAGNSTEVKVLFSFLLCFYYFLK